MKRKWKILLAVLVVLLVAGGVYGRVQYEKRGITAVQTGKVLRQDLSAIVTASGEIKPRNYINIGANYIGRLTNIYVREGDRVRRSQVVARLESVQAEADVAAQRAAVSSAQADSAASEAGTKAADETITTARASVDRAKAESERARIDFDRGERLYNDKLISRQEYETRRAAFAAQEAAVREAETRIGQLQAQRAQSAAQLNATQRRVTQIQATLRRASDVLDKYSAVSPIDGVVTNLPVRVGETVVPGIQNSPSSTIMTIADMSIITAEVKVDETDIVNVKLDQIAEVTVDAIPNRTFRGHVIEIGNTAILRSTGLAASQSAISSQEAKDFKVVVALDDPPEEIRPGLSCNARITTASRNKALSIPVQAVTTRTKQDLEAPPGGNTPPPATRGGKKEELQGVFVVENGKAAFRQVKTGITGATEIEVTNGLKEGDEVIIGPYRSIRTLRKDAKVKVDNNQPEKKES